MQNAERELEHLEVALPPANRMFIAWLECDWMRGSKSVEAPCGNVEERR